MAPLFPTGVNNDTPTERIHRFNNARRHPTNHCECKITVIEGTHCSDCNLSHPESIVFDNSSGMRPTVPVGKPTSIRYDSEAFDSSDLTTGIVAPVFPTGVSSDTPAERIQRSFKMENTAFVSLSSLQMSPLYLYNQKTRARTVSSLTSSETEELVLAPIVAEFDELFETSSSATPESSNFKVHGSPEFIDKVNVLNQKYDVFSTSVRKEPADVTPMEVKVNLAAWERPANSGPPRRQSEIKEKAILGQIRPLEASNVIRASISPYHSQVHMVPKVPTPTDPVDF